MDADTAEISDAAPRRAAARAELRRATAAHHDRVDRLFSRADLSHREGYARFLLAQAAAHLPIEEALTRAGAASVLPDWPVRRRADLLRADLAALSLSSPERDATTTFADPEEILGGVYVLEGSRLGGALLWRQVPPGLPTAFLGAGDSAGWRRLLALLEQRLVTDVERRAAIVGATRVFAVFEAAAAAL